MIMNLEGNKNFENLKIATKNNSDSHESSLLPSQSELKTTLGEWDYDSELNLLKFSPK